MVSRLGGFGYAEHDIPNNLQVLTGSYNHSLLRDISRPQALRSSTSFGALRHWNEAAPKYHK